MINIFIDTAGIVDEFALDPEQVNELMDFTVKEITGRFAQEWQNEANRTLKSSRQQYIASIVVADEGFAKGSVSLVGWLPNAVEQGVDSYDMKPGMLDGPNAKVGRDGSRYNTIPMSHGTPGALAENFSNIMPEEVYQVVKAKPVNPITGKSKGLTEDEIPAPYNEHQKKTVKMPKSQVFKEFQHKSSIYEGLRKNQDKVTGQNTYTTFRRVSDNSDPASWIHPGFEAVNIADKALKEFDVAAETGRAIDLYLSKL